MDRHYIPAVGDSDSDENESSLMCEGHARCTKTPVYTVTMHRINHCNKPEGRDAVFRLCAACTGATAYRMGEFIGESYEAMPEDKAGETLQCTLCGLWIADLSDVFDVEWITAA